MPLLERESVHDLLRSLLPAELSAYRGVAVPPWDDAGTSPEDSPMAADSLERLHLAACVSEFFCLHETGSEDRLLMARTIDEWVDLVTQSAMQTSGMAFHTSGSTAAPRLYHHSFAHIEAELAALAERLTAHPGGLPSRVVSWLPLHHLYGFMLGVALPRYLGIRRVAVLGTSQSLPRLESGDLLVTVPVRWRYLARSRRQWPANVRGVASTAPLAPEDAAELSRAGLAGLMDIYGSTETGGIATRWQSHAPYRLLCHWQRVSDTRLQRLSPPTDLATSAGESPAVPDRLVWQDGEHFRVQARLDDVVQVGGVNVSPAHVARRLAAIPGVHEAAVRPVQSAGETRLKAFLVPEDEAACRFELLEHLERTVAGWVAAERPVRFTLGSALPVNEMGKPRDWE